MPKDPGFTKQLGIRCDAETIERCRIAGGGNGEVAGARRLLDLGWHGYRQAVGLSGASRADRLRAIAAELDQEAASITVAPSGALMVSEPTADKIHQQRTETGAALITTRNGLLLFGLGADDGESCFAIDTEAEQLGVMDGAMSVSRKLVDPCPTVAALAQLVAGVLARTAATVAAGEPPTAAPASRHERLGLTVWGAHPADGASRIELGDAVVTIHSLALTALASELFALQGRLVADAIGRRQQLEAQLSRSLSREETSICWSRTHGE